jgi:hypothetical protein
VTLEITSLGLACEINRSPGFPIGAALSSKNLKPTGKAEPLAIVNGKFSFGPGLEGPCDSGKLTFSATHE